MIMNTYTKIVFIVCFQKNVEINWLLGRSCHLCSVWCATHLTQQSCVFIYVKRTICLVYCVTRYTHSHQHGANTKSQVRCYIDITSNWVNHFSSRALREFLTKSAIKFHLFFHLSKQFSHFVYANDEINFILNWFFIQLK